MDAIEGGVLGQPLAPTASPANGALAQTAYPANGALAPTSFPTNGALAPTSFPANGALAPTASPANGALVPTSFPANGDLAPTPFPAQPSRYSLSVGSASALRALLGYVYTERFTPAAGARHIYAYIYIYIIYMYMYVYICIYVYIYMHVYICIYVYMYVYMEEEGGARPPRPQLLPATHPPVLKPLNLDSSLYSTPLPDTKTTLPLLIIGDCRLVQQHPLSLPTRGFRNNGGLDLSGLGVLALPPPDPPYVAMPLDCGGQPPHT